MLILVPQKQWCCSSSWMDDEAVVFACAAADNDKLAPMQLRCKALLAHSRVLGHSRAQQTQLLQQEALVWVKE